MHKCVRAVRAALTAFAAAGCVAILIPQGAAQAASLSAYGQLPTLSDMALSPDGSRLAFARMRNGQRFIGVVELSTHKTLAAVRVGRDKLRAVEWAGNGHLLIATSRTGRPPGMIGPRHEFLQLIVFNLRTHSLTPLPAPADGAEVMNTIWAMPMVRTIAGHTVLFIPGAYVTDRTLPALFRYDLTTGGERIVEKGTQDTQQWFVDTDGRVAMRVIYREATRTWAIRVHAHGRLETVWSGHSGTDIPWIAGFGPQPDTVLIDATVNDSPQWQERSIGADFALQPIPDVGNFDDAIADPRTHCMIGDSYVTDDTHYHFMDPDIQGRWDSIRQAFKGAHVRLASISAGFGKVLVRVDGPRHGLAYYLVDTADNEAMRIGNVYAGINQIFPTRRITYTAADGLKIPAYLTLPAGAPPMHLPLIVLPHGGPAQRDTADFDWWAQALASQGYAVLQPNFRGSSLGWRFLSAGFGQWGRKMQTDLSDGVHYLARRGIIDPKRVCIEGGSYGGYAALAGVTLQTGIYRCAVSVAGLSDLPAFLDWVQRNHVYGPQVEQRYWDRFMGASGRRDPILRKLSPLTFAGRVSVPVLLIHGRDDTVVPYRQSVRMFKALRRAHKNVQLITLKHGDHWLSRGKTRLKMLQASVAFLRKYDPPH